MPKANGRIQSALYVLGTVLKDQDYLTGRAIQALLLVSQKPFMSVNDLANRAGMHPTTMSRILLDLGPSNRRGEPGLGLLEGQDNPANRRERIYSLSRKGRKLIERLER